MSLGPFDALFGFLGRLTNGDLHYAGLLVLVVLLVSLETGIWLGRLGARRHVPTEGEKSSVNFATAGMMGLLAFLLGVSLSMASDRYQQRRDSVLAEANAIGTVWLRASVGTGAEGVALQNLLREYTAVRIAVVAGSNTSPPRNFYSAQTAFNPKSGLSPAPWPNAPPRPSRASCSPRSTR